MAEQARPPQETIEVFFSYAHADEKLRDELEKHLSLLRNEGVIIAWHDRQIPPGEEWAGTIDAHLNSAQIILLLISPDFMFSKYCYGIEMQRAMERHDAREARVIPIILRSVDWNSAHFGKLQALPKDGHPVTLWDDPDDAFTDVARGIRAVAEELAAKPLYAPSVVSRMPPVGHDRGPSAWNAPYPRNPHFTGREDLLDVLHAACQAAQPVALTQVLRGLGGIGKTQLALEYAYRYGSEYDLMWWLRAEEPATLALDYATLAGRLRLFRDPVNDQNVLIEAVKRWLESHNNWLLIFDNASGPDAVRPYLPRNRQGQVMVTSRHLGWGGAARSLSVPPLSSESSVRFLLERTQQTDTESAAAVAEALGDLPLALSQAAAYVETTGITLSVYLERWHRHRRVLLSRGDISSDYPETVATTWEMAFQALGQHHPAAIDLLNLCSFFAPDYIPQTLIRDLQDDCPAALAAVIGDDIGWDDTVSEMRRYGLMEFIESDLFVHRLVQAVTSDRLSKDEQQRWGEVSIQGLKQAFPSGDAPSDPQYWPSCEQLLPHAMAAVSHINDTADAAEDVAWVLNQMGFYLDARAQFEQAKPYYERALAIYEQVLGPEHPDTASSFNNLGALLQAQGDLEGAKPYYERALAIREQVLGANHPDTALSLSNLGALLQAQGDLEGAKPYYERALAICEQVLGANHPDTARSLNNLGALLDSQGDLEGARPYYERALAICEQVLGANHPDTARSLNNLGALLDSQGDLEGARPYYERALAIYEQVLGPEHPDTASSLNNLGYLLQVQGDLEGARPYYERALAICEQVLGANHPDTASSLNNFGALLDSQGDLEGARPYYERALAIREQVLGANHPDTARNLNNLGAFLHTQGDLEGARPYYERALAICEQVLGANHPDTARSLNNLGYLLQAQGDLEEAKPYYERALAIFTRRLGDAHPYTQSVRRTLNALGL